MRMQTRRNARERAAAYLKRVAKLTAELNRIW